jgi:hypothetical protein
LPSARRSQQIIFDIECANHDFASQSFRKSPWDFAKLFGGAAIFAPGGDGGKKGLRNSPTSRFSLNPPPMAAPKKRIRGNGVYFLPSWT